MALCIRLRFRSPDGQLGGERVTYQLPVRIGRNAMNDCPLPHPFISEFHCLIDLVGGQLCVRDLNSKNGLFAANSVRLPPGQHVPLASLGNRFFVGPAVEINVETFEQQVDFGHRSSSVHGEVLGNRAVLGSMPSLPPLSYAEGAAMPPAAPMPPAHAMPPAPVGPPPMPIRYASPPAGVPSVGSLGQSLPGLPPVPGQYPPQAWNQPSQAGHSLQPLQPLPPLQPSQPLQPFLPAQPPQPAGVNRSTQFLSMPTELLAFAGLRELAASLVPGQKLETTGDIARLLTKLHDLVEVFCRCFVVLRDGYAQFVSSTGLVEPASRRINRSETALRVESARDATSLAAALLDWRNHDFDPPQVIESALVDIVMHHAALIEGVMRGVDTMLAALSPAALEQSVQQQGGVMSMLNRHKALWQAYEERFRMVADDARRFELIFGAEFAASYREYRARQSKSVPP
jgi:predicted component of type VI protein secretion system